MLREDFTPPSFSIEPFELPNGILGNHCQTIAQDSSGIMWFGSQRGLHRWDGYQFKTYINDPYDSSSISTGYIEKILVAKDHTFWLASFSGGISYFDLKTEKFINFFHDPEDENSINSNFVSDIIEDKEGYIWIATQEGLCRYSPKTKTFKRFTHDPSDPESLSHNICRKLYIDSDGVLWVGTGFVWESGQGGGLNKYDPKDDGKFIQYLHEPNNPKSLTSNKITEIFEDSKEKFWIGTAGDGLHLMDRVKGEFTRLQNQPAKNSQLSAPIISDVNNQFTHTKIIFEDFNQNLWIGSSGGGIKYYDLETGYSQHFFLGDGTENSLSDNYAWDMFQSRDGTLWGCTAGPSNGKVFKILTQNKLFDIQPVNFDDNYLGFYESADGITWFSQDEIGLIKMDAKTGDTLQYLDDPLNPVKFSFSNFSILQNTSAKFQNIDKIVEDRDRNLWMDKNVDRILIKFNPETGDYKEYHHDPKDNNSLSGTDVEDILVDKKGIVWLVTNNGDLNKYDPVKDHFTHISFIENQDIVKDINVYTIANLLLANDGTIWIAGFTHYSNKKSPILVQFDPNTQLFLSEQIYLRKYSIDQSSLPLDIDGYVGSHSNIIGVQEDEFGNIWVCTRYFIYKYNPSNSEIIYFDSEQFNSPYFNGFVIDDHGFLWLLGYGLIVFDPLNETKFNYGNLKNINELFFQRAIFKRSDGNILAGSHTALITFDPVEIRSNTNSAKKIKPEVEITEFNLINMQMKEAYNNRLFVSTWDQPLVKLTHDQNVFLFRFALLDFFDPKNNRLEFMLEGYDNGWRLTGLEPEVTYAKVPPGEYSFKVRGANYLGAWSDEEIVKVIISPPWWNTLWAKIAFYTSLIFLIFGFYRFQLNRRLQYEEANRLRELDSIKTQLYTNITHEFRTPLTVISGMITQIRENPKEWFNEGLNMISRNNDRLLNLVNQMLDLSKLESGKMALNLVQSDLVNYLKYLVEAFDSYAESEKNQLHFYTEVEDLEMDYDAEKLQQVVTNLLSNAVKFTPDGGHVYFSVREEKSAEGGKSNVFIEVRDTGIGISEEQIEHIFDRFYQVDVGGEIKVKSKQGTGTEFIIELPVKNEAIQSNPLDIEKNPVIENFISKASPVYKKYESVKSEPGTSAIPTVKRQILLIEDNPDVVAYVASFLEKDYQIKVGKDGQEGIKMALKNIPDLIISDVMMPYKDGFEVCNTLKNDERTSHIPIIMLTAKADIQSKLEGLERGADAYLPKPFHKEELLLRIKKLFGIASKTATALSFLGRLFANT